MMNFVLLAHIHIIIILLCYTSCSEVMHDSNEQQKAIAFAPFANNDRLGCYISLEPMAAAYHGPIVGH